MRAQLMRVRGRARRFWVDRRLRVPAVQLYGTSFALRSRSHARRALAVLRPVVGPPGSGPVADLDGRRVVTAGPLTMSFDDLAHHFAGAVVEAVLGAGIDVFVVRREGQSLVLGVDLADRARTWAALAAGLDERWLLVPGEEGTAGVSRVADASRRARTAPCWRIFEPFAWGDRATGADAAAVVSFWELGASGLVERVGRRGQERFDRRSPRTRAHIDGREYPGRAAFPVGSTLDELGAPVDLVYTWVDGQDPAWIESFRHTAERLGRDADDRELDPARYRSRDELRYSLRSVWAYCGWVRHVWIVTAGQRPAWLAEHDWVTVVDHGSILPDEALPTFNSHAIEAALHRIDGLAEHFVYLNDDVFIARPVRPEVFFTANGLARVFRSDARVPSVEDEDTPAFETALMRSSEMLRAKFGSAPTKALAHAPFPLLRSVQMELDDVYPGAIERTTHHRFRCSDDVSVATALGPYHSIATRRATYDELAGSYVNVESPRLAAHLDRIRLGGDLDTFCINETRAADADGRSEELIAEFFEAAYPVAAPWERLDGEPT